jgi:hypothetical protein
MSEVKPNASAPTMTAARRQDWICNYLAKTIQTSRQRIGDGPWHDVTRSNFVSTLDSDFVDAYLDATNAPCQYMILGANRCNALARDLKTLYDAGVLQRHASGIEQAPAGFPKWVWMYSVADDKIEECRARAARFDANLYTSGLALAG